DRLSAARSLGPTLAVMIGVQLLLLVLEWAPEAREFLDPILAPAQAGTALLAFGVSLWVLNGVGRDPALPRGQQALLLMAVVLTARSEGSGLLVLLAASLAYLSRHDVALRVIPDVLDRVDFLLEPWRWSLFALAL